ncbi:unannotated protein [freshwater metagenome]|uniref:Unannotated protein n=1 Tax=freshwater metagenome TaxID=449393 RepID=A0A6J7FGA5_9ZZZZ
MTETTLLALEHVAQRLEGAVAGAGDGTAATAVVEQCVDGLLQHALLVVHDDLGSTEVEQAAQTVVAVDHTTVEVVEVGGGEPATVELNHGTKLRRNDRHHVEHHRGGRGAVRQERAHHLEALDGTDLALALALFNLNPQLDGFGSEVEVEQTTLDGLRAHVSLEVEAEAVLQLSKNGVFRLEVAHLEVAEVIPHTLESSNLFIGVLANLAHFFLGGVLGAALLL